MLRRAGKAIIRRSGDEGVRLVILQVEGYGKLRLIDTTIAPIDLFASESDTVAPAKADAPVESIPAAPELPDLQRMVIPGLGLPHLVVNNTTRQAKGLLFSDGQFFFVPGNSEREFVVDPGTFHVVLATPGQDGPAPASKLHFSYQARYTLNF